MQMRGVPDLSSQYVRYLPHFGGPGGSWSYTTIETELVFVSSSAYFIVCLINLEIISFCYSFQRTVVCAGVYLKSIADLTLSMLVQSRPRLEV